MIIESTAGVVCHSSTVNDILSYSMVSFEVHACIPSYYVAPIILLIDREASPGYTQGTELVDDTGRDLGDYYGRLVRIGLIRFGQNLAGLVGLTVCTTDDMPKKRIFQFDRSVGFEVWRALPLLFKLFCTSKCLIPPTTMLLLPTHLELCTLFFL